MLGFGSIGALGKIGAASGAGAVLGPAAATLGAAEGLVNSYINYKNYQLQKDNYNYQKDLQNTIFMREDSSIQRRVADLSASGLSPVLAAGQGAGAGATVATNTPQYNKFSQLSESAQAVLGLMSQQADISKTLAEEEYLQQQAEKSRADTDYTKKATQEKAWNLQQSYDAGVRTNVSGIVGQLVDGFSAIKNSMSRKAETDSERLKRKNDAAERLRKGGTGRSGKEPKLWNIQE